MGIKFCSLSSGSSGNCQYIETDNTRILIDAGLSGKRIEELLSSIEVNPNTLDAIFVTHEHIDHSKGVGILSRRYDVPVYANLNTWNGMKDIIGNVKDKNKRVFITQSDIDIKDMNINPFNISHDALEPVGYVINYKNIKMSIMTDTGWVNDSMREKIKDSHLYYIESNHDITMLREGSYPWHLKQRILSTKGHLSNEDAGNVLGDILNGNNEIVLLAHLSQDNNLPEIAKETVRNCILNQGIDVDKDIRLELSYRDKATKVFNL